MSEPYEELIEGERVIRFAPSTRHEQICHKLHSKIAECLKPNSPAKLLPPRSPIKFDEYTILRPDISVLTSANSKIWLIGEIIDSGDHKTDTVLKKAIYEDKKLPRLWMIDPRYDNIEVYHATPYGMALHKILVNKEILTELALPGFSITIAEIFNP